MNWISVDDQLPSSTTEMVLAYVDNNIYIGKFNAVEIYNIDLDGSKKNYKKTINFYPSIWLENSHCDDCDIPGKKCGDDDQCTDCCEKDYEISLLAPCFGLEKVTHWQPLPEKPS